MPPAQEKKKEKKIPTRKRMTKRDKEQQAINAEIGRKMSCSVQEELQEMHRRPPTSVLNVVEELRNSAVTPPNNQPTSSSSSSNHPLTPPRDIHPQPSRENIPMPPRDIHLQPPEDNIPMPPRGILPLPPIEIASPPPRDILPLPERPLEEPRIAIPAPFEPVVDPRAAPLIPLIPAMMQIDHNVSNLPLLPLHLQIPDMFGRLQANNHGYGDLLMPPPSPSPTVSSAASPPISPSETEYSEASASPRNVQIGVNIGDSSNEEDSSRARGQLNFLTHQVEPFSHSPFTTPIVLNDSVQMLHDLSQSYRLLSFAPENAHHAMFIAMAVRELEALRDSAEETIRHTSNFHPKNNQ